MTIKIFFVKMFNTYLKLSTVKCFIIKTIKYYTYFKVKGIAYSTKGWKVVGSNLFSLSVYVNDFWQVRAQHTTLFFHGGFNWLTEKILAGNEAFKENWWKILENSNLSTYSCLITWHNNTMTGKKITMT